MVSGARMNVQSGARMTSEWAQGFRMTHESYERKDRGECGARFMDERRRKDFVQSKDCSIMDSAHGARIQMSPVLPTAQG